MLQSQIPVGFDSFFVFWLSKDGNCIQNTKFRQTSTKHDKKGKKTENSVFFEGSINN